VEFIDYGANTKDRNDDDVDILMNTGLNANVVKIKVADAIRDGIIENARNQPVK
jgi:hypothetical protein